MRIVTLSRLLPGAFILLCLCAAGPATQPDAPADAKVLTEKLRDEAAQKAVDFDRWPSIGERKMGDILVLGFDGPALAPRTLLTPTMRDRCVTIPGMPGLCSVCLNYNRAGRARLFRFQHLNDSDPEAPFLFSDLNAVPGRVMMSSSRETIRTSTFVQIIDDRTNPDLSGPHPDGECRLFVTVNDTASEEQLVSLTFIEGDLLTLIHSRRTVADLYVRPLLRELGQEQLMLPDLRIARQVLMSAPKVPPAIAREAEALVAKLGSEDFSERRAASAKLKQLGLPGAQALAQMDRSRLSTEQHNRVDEILNQTQPVSAAAAEKLREDKAFLIDCLELDDAQAVVLTRAALEKLTGTTIDIDPRAPLADRVKVADGLRSKWLPPQNKMPTDGSTDKP